jgi:hypothetical protein
MAGPEGECTAQKPKQPEQMQKSPVAGAGPLGLPPPSPEQAPAQGGREGTIRKLKLNDGSTYTWRALPEDSVPPWARESAGGQQQESTGWPLERRGAVFECAIPKVRPSPYDLRRMLRGGSITEEQAQEAEQEWRENLKTWGRQRLEKAISSFEVSQDRSARQNRQEEVADIAYELEALRAELRLQQQE